MDKIAVLNAQIEELYDAQGDGGSGGANFMAAIKGASAQSNLEKQVRTLTGEISHFKVENDKLLRFNVESETRIRSLVIQNEEVLTQVKSGKQNICDKFVKVEVMVPQIVEKIYQVEKYIETVNVEGKLELSKKERRELTKQIRAEVDSEIHMLTENILAY